MDSRSLTVLLIVLLLVSTCFAGETGKRLAIKSASGGTCYHTIYQYLSDVRVATAPILIVRTGGQNRFCHMNSVNFATASEPVRVLIDEQFISGTFAVVASSPYSREYTGESYFSTYQATGTPYLAITGYNTTYGPLSVVIPPAIGGVDVADINSFAFQNSAITALDTGFEPVDLKAFAFNVCDLETVIIRPNTSITYNPETYQWPEQIFTTCTSLTSITMQARWEHIPYGFAKDAPLTQLNILTHPSGAVVIEGRAFNTATRVTFEGAASAYSLYDSGDDSLDCFQNLSSLQSAFNAGGAGTYVHAASVWTKE